MGHELVEQLKELIVARQETAKHAIRGWAPGKPSSSPGVCNVSNDGVKLPWNAAHGPAAAERFTLRRQSEVPPFANDVGQPAGDSRTAHLDPFHPENRRCAPKRPLHPTLRLRSDLRPSSPPPPGRPNQ